MEKNKSFFDFDGTLIRINSFPYWIIFSSGYAFLTLRFKLFWKISVLLFKRKVQKKISHAEFKKELFLLGISDRSNQKFAFFLAFFERKSIVQELIKLNQERHSIVISSAAPEIYLKKTIEIIFPKIHHELWVYGSKIENGSLNDNYKEEKLRNLYKIQFLSQGENLTNLFTDSWDDSPLAYHSETIVLISPSEKCRKKYTENSDLIKKIKNL